MKKNAKIIYGVVAAAVIGVGYYLIQQSKLLQSVCYSVKGVNFVGVVDGYVQNDVIMEFYNYSDFQIRIKGYNLAAYVDETKVSTIVSNNVMILNPRMTTNVVIPTYTNTSVALGELISTAVDQFVNEESSLFTLKGTMTINAGVVSINDFPFETRYSTQQLIEEIKSEEECPQIV
jgi:LEA14-like dessication related protein